MAVDLKAEARHYFERGFNIVAISYINDKNGSIAKKALVPWAKWQTQRQTEEEFEDQPWDVADGFAIVCGFPNKDGLFPAVVDLDIKRVSEEAKARGRELLEQFPKTQSEETPSGGQHLFYLSRVKPRSIGQFHNSHALELIGSGKLCIMAPSKGYRQLNDSPPTIVEDIEGLFYQVLGVEDERGKGKVEEGPKDRLEAWLRQILNSGKLILRSKGTNYWLFNCPFHPPDNHPSFALNIEKYYFIDYHDNKIFSLKELAEKLKIKLDLFGGRFQPKPMRQIVEEAKPLEWLLKPLIPKRSVVMLAGKAGVGKSFMGLHLAHAIASGGVVFDRFTAERGRVLLIDEENNPTILKQRVWLMGLNPLDGIDCLVLQGFRLNYFEELKTLLASHNYSLIIIDNWTDTSLIDENKAWEVSEILSELRRLTYAYDCAFLIIHHLRKNLPYVVSEIDELRGSSVLVNEPDIVLLVQRDELSQDRIIKTVKMRFGEEVSFKVAFESKDGCLKLRWAGEIEKAETDTKVLECARIARDFLALKKRAKRKEIQQACQEFDYKTVTRAINLLLANGTIERVRRGTYTITPKLNWDNWGNINNKNASIVPRSKATLTEGRTEGRADSGEKRDIEAESPTLSSTQTSPTKEKAEQERPSPSKQTEGSTPLTPMEEAILKTVGLEGSIGILLLRQRVESELGRGLGAEEFQGALRDLDHRGLIRLGSEVVSIPEGRGKPSQEASQPSLATALGMLSQLKPGEEVGPEEISSRFGWPEEFAEKVLRVAERDGLMFKTPSGRWRRS